MTRAQQEFFSSVLCLACSLKHPFFCGSESHRPSQDIGNRWRGPSYLVIQQGREEVEEKGEGINTLGLAFMPGIELGSVLLGEIRSSHVETLVVVVRQDKLRVTPVA